MPLTSAISNRIVSNPAVHHNIAGSSQTDTASTNVFSSSLSKFPTNIDDKSLENEGNCFFTTLYRIGASLIYAASFGFWDCFPNKTDSQSKVVEKPASETLELEQVCEKKPLPFCNLERDSTYEGYPQTLAIPKRQPMNAEMRELFRSSAQQLKELVEGGSSDSEEDDLN